MEGSLVRDVAVLLNGNAKRVNGKVLKALEGLVSPEDLYYSRNLREARMIARRVVDRRYKAILSGGGDGTFMTFVTYICDYMQQKGIKDYAPRFGVLRLGTGNAVAAVFGASAVERENLARELCYAANGAATKQMRLLEVEGKRTPFAGLGLDAMILNDYVTIRELMQGTPLQETAKGLLGYWLGLISMGIPRYLTDKVPEAVIVNEGGDAWQVDSGGRRIGPVFKKGDILYKGPIRMVSVAKVPFYGFEFKLFPFAMIDDDRFHMCVHWASALRILSYLPSVWKGNYTLGSVSHFLADSVSVHLSPPAPFQIGGDGEGWRSYVKFTLASDPISVIDFKPNI